MNLKPGTLRGKPCWIVELGSGGTRKRQYFTDRNKAEGALKSARAERADLGKAWGLLTAGEKAEVMATLGEIRQSGMTLKQVWQMAQATPASSKSCPTLGAAITETIEAKERAKRRPGYIDGLQKYLEKFASGRESLPVNQVTLSVIEDWFAARNESPSTRRSNLGRLSALFDLCWRRRYIPENPCIRVEPVSIDRKAASILTPKQVIKAILWARRRRPGFLGWLALSLFVGLRPESEADLLGWDAIDLDRQRIRIEAAQSKIRRHRLIDLSLCPPAVEWLRIAKALKSPLPLPYATRRRYLRGLRNFLGLKRWPQDILRHTAASNLLAHHQDAGKVAAFLGNSAGILLRDYKALIFKEDAAKFMGLLPKPRHQHK